MSEKNTYYDVRERTVNLEHASVDDVCEFMLSRGENPRKNHADGHFDEAISAVVDRYGEGTIREAVRLILTENVPFRTAAAELEMRSGDGVRIGTTAGWFLDELNAEEGR